GDTVNNGCIILEVDENKISSMSPRKFVWTYAEFQSGKSSFTITPKTGYTFYRWVNRSDSSIYADALSGLNPAENKLIVYTAQFNDAKKKLTLVVDNNKGTLNGLLSTNVFNDPTYFLNNRDYIYVTKKTEERFAGWRDTADDKIYKTLSLYNWDGSKDVTLEAVFKTDPVLTITVDSNKGTYTGKTSYEDLAQFNQDKATIKNSLTPLPTYKFDGWTGSNSANYKDDLSDYTWDASDDFTLTARFSLIIKHLTFETDTNKGTFDSSAKLSYDTSELGSIAAPTVNRKLGYAFLNWVKKGTTTVFEPTTWDGVADLVLVANFEQLAIFKFDIPMVDVQDVIGDTEFDPQSGTITRPTVNPKTGKKQDGWTVNGEYKTDAEVDNIISNWDQVSDIVIKVLLVELKTLKFEINQDKATIDPSAKLSFDSDDTSITRPSFTVKKGYGLDYWKKGNTSVQDADLAADIAAWRALTESKKEHIIYVAIFRKLKEFRFSIDDNLIDPAHPINKDDLVFDESNPPQTSNVPSVTPRYGYNNPSDNGGWTNKKGGTKADILTPEQLRDIIDDWNSKPSGQKPDVELYYVFVEDDTIPKVKFVVDRTKGGFNGGTVYTDTTDFDNAKSSINVVAFNNYKFVGWKDTTTNEQFANASLITWDGTATKVYEAVFDVVNTPNNGGGRNNGGGGSGGGSSSDSYDVKPPDGFNGETNGPFNPMDPNQPPKPQQPVNPQDEMSSEEKIANPPSENFLIVRMDTATSERDTYTNANLNLNGNGGGDSVFKWETTNRVTWRLMKIDNVVENIEYVKTLDKNVVGSLETDRIYYYKDGWAFLEYKGTKEWYHFGLNNIMDTGWIFQNGNIYYL
ncbi:MAG: hypothetical protein II411_04875, partial [Lachnospiraceae bacterium]|nr:hypothetical protein [Lachnospiraceae bacterium]